MLAGFALKSAYSDAEAARVANDPVHRADALYRLARAQEMLQAPEEARRKLAYDMWQARMKPPTVQWSNVSPEGETSEDYQWPYQYNSQTGYFDIPAGHPRLSGAGLGEESRKLTAAHLAFDKYLYDEAVKFVGRGGDNESIIGPTGQVTFKFKNPTQAAIQIAAKYKEFLTQARETTHVLPPDYIGNFEQFTPDEWEQRVRAMTVAQYAPAGETVRGTAPSREGVAGPKPAAAPAVSVTQPKEVMAQVSQRIIDTFEDYQLQKTAKSGSVFPTNSLGIPAPQGKQLVEAAKGRYRQAQGDYLDALLAEYKAEGVNITVDDLGRPFEEVMPNGETLYYILSIDDSGSIVFTYNTDYNLLLAEAKELDIEVKPNAK